MSEYKFKVGDKVRINPSIKPEELYFGSGPYTQDKSAISGKIMKITNSRDLGPVCEVLFPWYCGNINPFEVLQKEIIPVCILPEELFEMEDIIKC